jgi:hypothetical protein
MILKTAIMDTRLNLGLPENGFPDEAGALKWYTEHYQLEKGTALSGGFGFHYNSFQSILDFECKWDGTYLSFSAPAVIDKNVRLDVESIKLARSSLLPSWLIPAMRLVILIGKVDEDFELRRPQWLAAPVGNVQALIVGPVPMSLKEWRRLGEILGVLPGKLETDSIKGLVQSYESERKNSKNERYWQTLMAFYKVRGIRIGKGISGKRGILKETAEMLVKEHGWESLPETYTVRKYLDRAEKHWRFAKKLDEAASHVVTAEVASSSQCV